MYAHVHTRYSRPLFSSRPGIEANHYDVVMVVSVYLCVYMTTMQSITQSAVQERLVMKEELKKALDHCEELEQSSVPMGYTRVLQTTGDKSGTVYLYRLWHTICTASMYITGLDCFSI